MKVAGKERRNKPNRSILWQMQMHAVRGWVYREGQGWSFSKLTPEELAELRSYEPGITIPRMRIRLPYDVPLRFFGHEVTGSYATFYFAYCTVSQADSLLLSRFRWHEVTSGNEPLFLPVKAGDYETWLWSDEVKACRELGYKVAVHHGWGWKEWGVPAEWKAPSMTLPRIQRKERTFIYALVDDLTQEVRYVGKADDPERRLRDHLRETKNPAKQAWIQSLEEQNREPQVMILEEVAVAEEYERENFWIRHYEEQGCILTNAISQDRLRRKEEVLWIQAHFHVGDIIRPRNIYPRRWLLLDSITAISDHDIVGRVIPIKHDGTRFKQSAMGCSVTLRQHIYEVIPFAELRQKSRGELQACLNAHNPEEKTE